MPLMSYIKTKKFSWDYRMSHSILIIIIIIIIVIVKDTDFYI